MSKPRIIKIWPIDCQNGFQSNNQFQNITTYNYARISLTNNTWTWKHENQSRIKTRTIKCKIGQKGAYKWSCWKPNNQGTRTWPKASHKATKPRAFHNSLAPSSFHHEHHIFDFFLDFLDFFFIYFCILKD